MLSRCRAFTPASYTPNILFIWWYTPCRSVTCTVRPSSVSGSTPAGAIVSPSVSVTPAAKPRRIASVSGVSSVTTYCFSTWWAGERMSCASAPSSVSSTKPVLVLSSRPAGNSSRRGKSAATRSTTVVSFLSRLALTTPSGLLSMIYTNFRYAPASGTPSSATAAVCSSSWVSALRQTAPSMLTRPFVTALRLSLRVMPVRSARYLSSRIMPRAPV